MEQVVYTSIAREGLGSEEVFSIIQTASRLNPGRDITGFLMFRDGRFLQVVEGPGEALDRLLDDLLEDPRHHSIAILERREITARSFPHWRMKRVTRADEKVFVGEIRSSLGTAQGAAAVMRAVEEFLETSAA